MILLLMRHGIAEEGDRSTDAGDAERELTAKGRARVRTVVQLLRAAGWVPTVAFSSPRIRAVQTAKEALGAFEIDLGIEITSALDFGGWLEDFQRQLAQMEPNDVVLAVGHEPQLGEWLGVLLGSRRAFPMKKGAVAILEFEGLAIESPPALSGLVTARLARHALPHAE